MTHAVVWIDHKEARIFHVQHFFDHVARELEGVDSVLIVGPASAKH